MRYLKKRHNLNARGDTIVEVMIVLAVLSLAFSVSTATATRSLSSAHTAQEHSEAQSLLDQQLELLRQSIDQDVDFTGRDLFCLPRSDNLNFIQIISFVDVLDTTSYSSECNPSGGLYFQSITKVPATVTTQEYYDLKVLWEGAGNRGIQKVETYYRVHPLAPVVNSGINLAPAVVTPPDDDPGVTGGAGPGT